jgi:hypothetical protein
MAQRKIPTVGAAHPDAGDGQGGVSAICQRDGRNRAAGIDLLVPEAQSRRTQGSAGACAVVPASLKATACGRLAAETGVTSPPHVTHTASTTPMGARRSINSCQSWVSFTSHSFSCYYAFPCCYSRYYKSHFIEHYTLLAMQPLHTFPSVFAVLFLAGVRKDFLFTPFVSLVRTYQ